MGWEQRRGLLRHWAGLCRGTVWWGILWPQALAALPSRQGWLVLAPGRGSDLVLGAEEGCSFGFGNGRAL